MNTKGRAKTGRKPAAKPNVAQERPIKTIAKAESNTKRKTKLRSSAPTHPKVAIVHWPDAMLHNFAESAAPWYETPADVDAGLAWGRRKARLLRWLRRQMRRRLSEPELRAVEHYFFRGRTLLECGKAMRIGAPAVHRAIRRSIGKLKAAAEEEGKTLNG